jgi:peptide chain release factor 1
MPPQADPLLKKLDELDRRLDELTARMQDPAVASDHSKYTAVAREHAGLAPLVKLYRRFKDLADQRDQAQHIVDDPASDKDLKALAAEELPDLQRQAEAALDEVKSELVMSDDHAIHSVML